MSKEMFAENRFIEKIYDIYHYCRYTFPERLGRSIAFFKLGWLSYDFDYMPLHEAALFKLKRMLYCFENYGHHAETCENYKPKMKSIKLAIKLLEKYCKNDYTRFYDMHEKKWGKSTCDFVPVDVEGNIVPKEEAKYFKFNSSRPNAQTEEEKAQERKEFLEAYNADEREQEKHLRWAYAIITKYHRYWWD